MPCDQPLPGVRRSVRPALREFLSPAPLLAVVLLGVNDRWLKPAFHNALTGKLSDLAGCFFLPLYLSALLGLAGRLPLAARLRTGCLATLALFAPLKLWPEAARLAEAVLTALGQPLGLPPARITVDPTDLVALPLIAAAYAYGLRAGRQ